MKSRHNNKTTYLTGIARRTLLLFTLLLCIGNAWGQVTNLSTGIIDSPSKISVYSKIIADYTTDVSSSVPDLESWTGGMVANNGPQHWNGINPSNYFEQTGEEWKSTSGWSNSKSTTITLPKGKYVLLCPARQASSDKVNAYVSVGGASAPVARGDTGRGITTDGVASFDIGSFANSNNGRGWKYSYVKFEVTADNTGVTFSLGGQANEEHMWMSFTQPQLLKIDPTTAVGTDLTAAMFHRWSSPEANADETGSPNCAYDFGTSTGLPYGDGNVYYLNYADLTNYKQLVLKVAEGTPRLLFNRAVPTEGGDSNGGDYLQINSSTSEYVFVEGSTWTIDLEKIALNNGGYAHLNSFKGASGNVTVTEAKLIPYPEEAYTFELYNTGYYLNLTDAGAIVTSTPQELYFVRKAISNGNADNLYFITDGTHYLGTSDNVAATTTEGNKKAVQTLSLAAFGLSGYHSLSCVTDKYIGVDNPGNGAACIVNRTRMYEGEGMDEHNNKNLWRILKTTSPTETDLTRAMFHTWSGPEANATDNGIANCEYNFGTEANTAYGNSTTSANYYADLSQYKTLTLEVATGTPRLFFNRTGGDASTESVEITSSDSPYVTVEGNKWIINIAKIVADKGYAHLNAIKGPTYDTDVKIMSAKLLPAGLKTADETQCETHVVYQLDEGKRNFTVDLAYYKDKIREAFDKTAMTDFTSFYLRWYVIDKNTNKPLENLKTVLTSNAGSNHYSEHEGHLWFNNTAQTPFNNDAAVANALNVDVALPADYTQHDVIMVCVMTDDIHDLYPQNEPTNLKHKFFVRFVDAWNAANNTDLPMTSTAPAETFKTKLKIDLEATQTPADQLKNALVALYQEASASATALNGAAPQYVHVYLTNSNGALIDATSDDNWNSAFSNADTYQNKRKKGYVWVPQQSWVSSDINTILNTVLTKRSAYSWENMRVVCDMTDDLTGSYFVDYAIMEEPSNLKARLIVSFKEDNGDTYSATTADLTRGMAITRKHYNTETAALDLAASDNFSDVNSQFGNHLNDNSNIEKFYLRWYLADKDGEWVPTPTGITLSPVYAGYADKIIGEKNYGKVLYLGNAGAVVTADMLKMNIEVSSSDVDLNDYQVVCALAYAEEGYTTEPSPLKAKYIYSFVSPFEGKLSSDAFTHTKEVIVTREDQTVGYVTIPLDNYYSEILSDYNTNATDLGQSLHIRWYVLYNGEQFRRSDLQLLGINNSDYKIYPGGNDKDGYLYWNTATSASTATEGRLNVKFTIPTTDTNWESYKVVAVMSNDTSADNGQVVSGGTLDKEPQSLNMIYTFSLIDGIFKFVHHKGAAGRDYFTHNDDVNINAPSGEYTMTQTTIFLPTEANLIGGRGDGIFTSDRYTLGTAKAASINPATGEAAPEGAKYGGLTVKKDNPTKTAIFHVSGVNSVTGYLVSNSTTESRTCNATATPTDGSTVIPVSGTSSHEGETAVITFYLDPNKEYTIDFSDSRKTGTEEGADMSLQGVRFEISNTEPHLYSPSQYTQYSWDNENSRAVIAERGDIRQGVHTVNYDVFINPYDSEPKMLKLPFEAYTGNGNNLEPMAYIRWYDWSSDLGSTALNKVGTWLKQHDDDAGSRGFFMLNNSLSKQNPTHAKVGVTYDPTHLTTDGDIIACDVSKYYDGLYPGREADDRAEFSGLMYPQFVHEPTLSTRYLFHVYPSSVIAEKILTGHNALQNGINSLYSGTSYADVKASMFNSIYEDNGRVVVSLNGSAGTYALRADLYSLDNYYLDNGYTKCNHISWYAFLEDERGLWRKDGAVISNSVKRIELFELSNLSGNYNFLNNNSTNKSVEAAPGMRFHLVGYVGNGNNEQAAVHYELQFLDAPAIMADNLASINVKRTSAYLEQNFRKSGEVTFDEYFADKSEPTTESNNMLYSPLPWEEAEYGFCYPKIDKYRIRTGWSGITPIHGDYMLVKSIKKANVSAQCDDTGDVPATGCEYAYHWYTWDPAIMYDYTHQLNADEYGGYIYVDASDESRTIATLDFTASLCSGSQIYFTAAISDITSGDATSPQLMAHVYARNEFGEKIQVISFLTSVLNTVNVGDNGYKHNKWYQVYGHGNIPENIDISNYSDFSVEIDNYSKDTNGADFCVDQIVFYTSTGKMQVEQTGGMCENQDLSITAFMDVEHLEAMVTLGETPKTLYYRIYQKTGTGNNGEVLYQIYPDPSIYNNNGKSYGQVETYKYVVDENGALDNTTETNIARNKPYKVKNGILYYKLIDDKVFNLPQGYEYFIAMTENLQYPQPDGGANDWADPNDPCDVYSNFFVPRKTFISFLDTESQTASTTIISNCENYAANDINYTVQASVPDEKDPSGFRIIPGVRYDFFIGTTDELRTGGAYAGLLQALGSYRDYETDYLEGQYKDYLDEGFNNFNSDYYTTLYNAIQVGKLIMSASENLTMRVLETTSFVALPVKEVYTVGDTDYHLCDYLPFTITVDGLPGIPQLALGFDDVDYTTAGTERVLRVGLEQLNKMRTQGYKLHIPVSGYKDKKQQTFKKLYFPAESYLTLSATTDNTASTGKKFAKIVPINSADTRPSVDKNHMYLSLDLSGDNCAIDFHEGYQYEVSVSYLDEDDENVTNPCIGDLFILIKVVPEFVTWESQPVGADGNTTTSSEYYSANWYNDDNWKRSTRAELYKDAKGGSQNTATTGHPNGYEDNGEGSLSSLSGNSGFVPMKFTYVTLPTGNHAPSLINEPRVTGVGVGSRRQGGGFLDLTQTTLLTDRSPRDPDGTPDNQRTNSKPTENIYYDMLVRYSYTPTDPFGEGCFGHRQLRTTLLNSEDALTAEQATLYNNAMSPTTPKVAGDILSSDEAHAYNWIDQGEEDHTVKVFDCEKYQGNVCRDIYFKPGAELLRQQRLTYQRAWVEIEMDANRWYLLASPLQCTYAGDMYVPTSMTNVADNSTVKGRQVTEAFQPIKMTDNSGNLLAPYSRTKYPIYQRSWGMNNGNVYTKQNDIRANSYSANLNYSAVTTDFVEWGHTFNDVQVPYHISENTLSQNLAGFSIRAHKKNQTDKTLIRLPKADTSYEYYDWTDTNSDPAASGVKAVSKPNFSFQQESVTLFTVPYCYRLVTDEHQHDGDLEYSISAMQQNGDYVLVGNPYMVSIDMKKFFETNSSLSTDGYWTYEGNTATAYTVPTQTNTQLMKPMQAFFVKKGEATQITFNRQMQVDGNFPPPASSGSGVRGTTLTLNAANSRGSSSASVELNEKASDGYAAGEDVETLFDSNLADVPMVYTVSADGKAVSINQQPTIDVVPFGVTCNSDEPVEVTIDNSQFTVDNSQLYVFDALLGTTIAVNDGETVSIQPNDYGRYYLTTTDILGIKPDGIVDGIVISVRNGVVTVTANSQISLVRAVSVSGASAYEQTDCGTNTQFCLQPGTYVIEAEGGAGKQTAKILVK